MVIEDSGNKNLKFKNPERLLLVVIAFIFWSIGFIDLLGHTSATPTVVGLYSIPLFALILLYGLSGITWVVLFFSPKTLSRLSKGVEAIQRRSWLALTMLAGLGLALWIILEWDRWASFPGLQVTAFFLTLLAAGILIFSGWRDNSKKQWWRSVIAYPLLVLVAVEAVIQIAAGLGILPGTHTIGGNFVPYERVYYNAEGFRNDTANRYGWYYPDSSLNDEARKIVIFGTSRTLALQVPPEQQFSPLLSASLKQSRPTDDVETQVITVGLPGFGPGPYLYEAFMEEFVGEIKPDEIIVMFDLGDDFQSASPSGDELVYSIDDSGSVIIDGDSKKLRHDLSHYFLRGYYSFQFVETLRSHYLTPQVISSFAQSWSSEALARTTAHNDFDIPRLKGAVTDHYALTEPTHAGITATRLEKIRDGNNFIFNMEEPGPVQKAVTIAGSFLKLSQQYAARDGFTLRVVTIPVFPKAFYAQDQIDSWEPVIADYDLLLPEKALAEIAETEDISFLAMGQQMYKDNLTVDEIRGFYYSDGQGHFTPAGHKYFANAIFTCFFEQKQDPGTPACATR